MARRGPKPFGDWKTKLRLVSKSNPKRKGEASYRRFNLYPADKVFTVEQAVALGVFARDIRHDHKHGYIEVVT